MNDIEMLENDISILKFKLYTCDCTTVDDGPCVQCLKDAEEVEGLESQLAREVRE